ncbi:YqaA family protein [Paraliomyxa miuraensis]|uniref:YqaA family protein n=1 Tax=Paraliomyxa miuraensis TaxID=376150 RepID=UPI00225145CA|nr:VTT domain-containing protein [Paraliomyxa miuraensis]MCX4242484.1 VTT domain-containing protein [Paraliomyxa miuraensis]
MTARATAAADELDARRLIVSSLLAVAGLVAVIAILGAWFREPLLLAGRWFVDELGGPGIAVGFLVPDAFTVPIPNDAFLALGRAGGMPTVPLVAWALLGSVSGGSIGWLIGRALRRTRGLDRFLTGRGAGLDRALRRRGPWVVAIAAITPLPYSVSAWAAGSTAMPYPTFFAVSLLRVVRIVGALYLIDLGLMSVT